MKKPVLVVGNEMDSSDAIPLNIIKEWTETFPRFVFIPWDPTEELPEECTSDIVLIDSVKGIRNVRIFNSLDEFYLSPRNTVHDFDLPVALKLLQKLHKIDTVKIIGIPYGENTEELKNQVLSILQSI